MKVRVVLSLFALVTSVLADEYGNAMKEWCSGLSVLYPDATTIISAGDATNVTVSRKPNDHRKTITGLDLYSVSRQGKAQYIQNIWSGSYRLKSKASISDTIPKSAKPGLYFYRVWVTNEINGMHGPDCLETSHTFKLISGAHMNAEGLMYYTETLDDIKLYHPDHFKGCFGIDIEFPQEGSIHKQGNHIFVSLDRDRASQTDALLKIDLYKSIAGQGPEHVATVWKGNEVIVDKFSLMDHLHLPHGKLDPSASYYYSFQLTSKKIKDETCTFHSKAFKIEN
ncbi:hypothetical protein DFQ28_002248 [Apophysomyces sp. BC1034]|nr:hypothetical protein DFQ30_002816 [Apophysomyces sp. BC1015]KAG0179759.1 hypothetical protein DFQ29_001702 [Apophysomyces sp. BC1021]KAG0190298.1 hypothetical protein DFQ28_002248 [Apophysomyces sp. BC1034]